MKQRWYKSYFMARWKTFDLLLYNNGIFNLRHLSLRKELAYE